MSILLGAAMAAAMIAPQGYADVQQRVAPVAATPRAARAPM